MLPRLILNLWAQVILLPWPYKYMGLYRCMLAPPVSCPVAQAGSNVQSFYLSLPHVWILGTCHHAWHSYIFKEGFC